MRMNSMSVLAAGLVLATANLLPGPARAQADSAQPAVQDAASIPIGRVVTVVGSVTIQHKNAVIVQANVSGQASPTKVGDLVYLNDVVLTEAGGRVGINFVDGTSFNLSSNARMVLNEFVYDPNGKSNSSLLSLTKGTFTFVAGNIAKTGDMKVDTPVATMGIRGTTPHIEISDDGTVRFSTLIEEGKSRIVRRVKAPATQQPEQKLDHTFDPKICRGC